MVEGGRLRPGRAIDLGCGVGDNAIFLAQHGFNVTGVDFAASAIARARRKATAAGAKVEFIVDDLTHMRRVRGPYDLLVDYGTLDDLGRRRRDQYVKQVTPLAHAGSQFLLWCFEWELQRWERLLTSLLPFGGIALAPGEAQRRFGQQFDIEQVGQAANPTGWPRGYAAYLMTRR